MTRPLKVYGGHLGDERYVVAAGSWAEAGRIIRASGHPNVSDHYLRGYWAISGNVTETVVTAEAPRKLLVERPTNSKRYAVVS